MAETPARFYKFLDQAHTKAFLAGSLRLGGFDSYSLLEIMTGDSWIGDREEARSFTSLDVLSKPGLDVKHSNIVLFTYGYCLSLSSGDFESICASMTDSGSPYYYDACIEIVDISQFIHRIGLALENKFPNFRQMGFDARKVVYSDAGNQHNARHWNDFNAHNPFSKPSRYSQQSEFRIANIMDEADQKENFLYINVGDISDITRQTPIVTPESKWVNPFKFDEHQANQEIKSVLSSLELPIGSEAKFREAEIDKLIYAYGCLRFNQRVNLRLPELDRSIILYDPERRIPYEKRVTSFSMHGEMIIGYLRSYAAAM